MRDGGKETLEFDEFCGGWVPFKLVRNPRNANRILFLLVTISYYSCSKCHSFSCVMQGYNTHTQDTHD